MLTVAPPPSSPTVALRIFTGPVCVATYSVPLAQVEMRSALHHEREGGVAFVLLAPGMSIGLTATEAVRAADFLSLPFPPIDTRTQEEVDQELFDLLSRDLDGSNAA